jgi:glycosyltransferase involved in cell wall biosynthesis
MYNERENILVALAQAQEVIPRLGFEDYEILVVDDGSRDDSAELVERMAASDPHIRLVRHPRNLGYGSALRTGFLSARCEVVFYTDSDLPVDLSELEQAVPRMEEEGADLIIGYRIERFDTPRRALYSRVYNFLMRLLFGVRVRDVNFSFKLVRRRVLDRISLTAKTVFIDGQLLAEAVRHGFEILEVPIIYKPRRHGESSFNSLRAAWDTLVEMLRHRLLPGSVNLQKAAVAALEARAARVKDQAELTEFDEARPWSAATSAPAEPVVPQRRAAGQK